MKKTIYFLFIVSFLIVQSCIKDEENIFDSSAAERMTTALSGYNTILQGAPNGWIMEYYPEEEHAIGGYIFLCSFNSSGQVTVASEITTKNHQPGDQVTSLYKFISDQGPVLSFDTYNEIFHYFSEPSGSDVDGNAGDYEFIVTKADQDSVIMKGKKYANKIVMTPLPEGTDWNEYLQQIIDVENQCPFGSYKLFLNDNQDAAAVVTQTERAFNFEYTEGGETETISQSFIYTTTGLKFYEPFTLGGVTMEHFDWNSEENAFVCSDAGVSARLEVSLPDNYMYYSDYIGNWNFEDYYGTVSITISEKEKNKTFLVSGLDFDILMNYNRANGTVEITTQEVGTYEGYTVLLCAWSLSSGGYFNSNESNVGMVGEWDGEDPDNILVNFSDNGQWSGYEIDSFIFYMFTSSGSGVGVYSRLAYVSSMTKQ